MRTFLTLALLVGLSTPTLAQQPNLEVDDSKAFEKTWAFHNLVWNGEDWSILEDEDVNPDPPAAFHDVGGFIKEQSVSGFGQWDANGYCLARSLAWTNGVSGDVITPGDLIVAAGLQQTTITQTKMGEEQRATAQVAGLSFADRDVYIPSSAPNPWYRVRFQVTLAGIFPDPNKTTHLAPRCRVYIDENNRAEAFRLGDRIHIFGKKTDINGNVSTFSFDADPSDGDWAGGSSWYESWYTYKIVDRATKLPVTAVGGQYNANWNNEKQGVLSPKNDFLGKNAYGTINAYVHYRGVILP